MTPTDHPATSHRTSGGHSVREFGTNSRKQVHHHLVSSSPEAVLILAAVVLGFVIPVPSHAADQPKARWSTPSIRFTLAPGDVATTTLTITADTTLADVYFEAVPEISPFVSIDSSHIGSLKANTPLLLALRIAIPVDVPFGTFDGTVHLRFGSQTLPQTLKVRFNIWRRVTDVTSGMVLAYPPDWVLTGPTDGVIALSHPGPQSISVEASSDIIIAFHSNPHHLPWDEYFNGINGPDLADGPPSVTTILVGSQPALRLTNLSSSLADAVVIIPSSSGFVVVTSSAPSDLLTTILESMSIPV
jgi:hypothetical protein